MVRSMWLPVTSGVASLCIGIAMWPPLASTADGLSVSAVLFGTSADATLLKNPLDALFQRLPIVGRSGAASMWTSSSSSSADQAIPDLRVGNLSVHRIRYERGGRTSISKQKSNNKKKETSISEDSVENQDQNQEQNQEHNQEPERNQDQEQEENLIRSVFGSAWAAAAEARKSRTQPLSSIVVTWEDHRLAAEARPAAQTLCAVEEEEEEEEEEEQNKEQAQCRVGSDEKTQTTHSGREIQYELQVWVNGWGLDALWHPANRKIATSDPFVVLNDLPQEQELGFRVRMKVKTTTGLLSGFFATEVDGPWSPVATLSPSNEHALEAIVAFFAANKFFGAVLALCIGLSVVIILRLVVSSLVYGRRPPSATIVDRGSVSLDAMDLDDDEPRHGTQHRRRRQHRQVPVCVAGKYAAAGEEMMELLHQEVADLRQELADSEAEVRRLMLFRGYGIESLTDAQLEELETELLHSVKLVQKRRRHRGGAQQPKSNGSSAFESLEETEEEDLDEEDNAEDGHGQTKMPALARHGTLGTVYEDNDRRL